ncbi:thiol reductant ABC exporter subunit CydD [Pseudovibrio sp. SPO723]|uniref:thiol reductant ABC exporter subunit CydD n=1 Tax=Nesiotobacter zosterae TaxID=392721 RepID=UPI0029C1DA33|nr:thiol reductant ABC exporter subunit CydD [Pseudovibrio sp. SPO723]MDX5592874.1 thiol reductant ABC exporter subunit CydD [Pseudovibrio sp. SPO723]
MPVADAASEKLKLLLAPVRKRLKLSGYLTTVASLLWIGQAALVAMLVASLLQPELHDLSVWAAALGFLALGACRIALDTSAGRISFNAADDVISKVRAEVAQQEALRSPQCAGNENSAALASLLAEKLDSLRVYITRYQPAQVRVGIVPLVILGFALWHSWVVALILFIAGPLIPVFMILVGMAARSASEKQMQEIGSLNALLMEHLSAAVDIRALGAVERSEDAFKGAADTLRQQTMKVLGIAFLSSTVLELFAALGVAMVAVFVGFTLLGEITFGSYATQLTVYEGVFLLLLAPDYFQPLRDLAAAWHDKASAVAVAGELAEREKQELKPILGRGGAVEMPRAPAPVAWSGLHFSYGSEEPMRYQEAKVPAGTSLAIVGASGSGKSTLLALIAGLIPPSGGTLRIGEFEMTAETADQLRSNMDWVAQTPHFLAETVRRNLSLARGHIPADEIDEALQSAQANGVVERLPDGLFTRLGETGAGVSGGEARRLLLARAMLSDAGIILADEPTADLDGDTARQITESLLALKDKGATLIVATHDKALADKMDQQLVLEAQNA